MPDNGTRVQKRPALRERTTTVKLRAAVRRCTAALCGDLADPSAPCAERDRWFEFGSLQRRESVSRPKPLSYVENPGFQRGCARLAWRFRRRDRLGFCRSVPTPDLDAKEWRI